VPTAHHTQEYTCIYVVDATLFNINEQENGTSDGGPFFPFVCMVGLQANQEGKAGMET
jgi:hypothetical protein